jgi:hypothetical protein
VNVVILGRERSIEPVERSTGCRCELSAQRPDSAALAVTCRGRPRDKCGTNGPADSAFRQYRASDCAFARSPNGI